jgi:hypothetical protein
LERDSRRERKREGWSWPGREARSESAKGRARGGGRRRSTGERMEEERRWEGSGARRAGLGAADAREKYLARSAREEGSGAEGSDGEHQWK